MTQQPDTHTVHEQRPKKESRLRNFFKLGEVGGYFFRSKDPARPNNFNIRAMHTINKISIVVFLAGVIFLILKRLL